MSRHPRVLNATVLLFFALASQALAQKAFVYTGDITPHSALISWGTVGGTGNTIGRASTPMGNAVVRIANKDNPVTGRNWFLVEGLQPDTEYPYEITINGRRIGGGSVRTYPLDSTRLAFMVIGDYGNGSSDQQKVAGLMRTEFLRRAATDAPVRFVATLGDNIYGSAPPLLLGSGNQDKHWEKKFFQPYADIIRHVPWRPSLGNHDGNDSESQGDLPVYLDNFFFPGNEPARYYQFSYGTLADFFVLDTTTSTAPGVPLPGIIEASEQTKWLRVALGASKARWKIVYFHHPPVTAGPEHPDSMEMLRHWVELFKQTGVNVVFSGHEHNFQIARKTALTGDIQFVVAGSGGKLRDGISAANAKSVGVLAYAEQRIFLEVEINGGRMEITPYTPEKLKLIDTNGVPFPLPLVVTAK